MTLQQRARLANQHRVADHRDRERQYLQNAFARPRKPPSEPSCLRDSALWLGVFAAGLLALWAAAWLYFI